MASTRNNTSTNPKCTCCNGRLDSYVSKSELYKSTGQLPFCKNCIDEEYERLLKRFSNDIDKTIYYLCMKLDMPFYVNVLNGAKQEIEKTNGKLNRIYITKINSFRNKNGYGNTFWDGELIYDSKTNNINSDPNSDSDFNISEEIVRYWGACKENWEYDFLEEEITRIKASFECPDYSMEMIMKDIALLNLDAEKIRRGLLKSDLLKTIEARSKLMNDANMKPVQSTGAEASDQITFGTLIKKWENEKPVKKRLDDEMKKYIDTFMVGQLARMEGLQSEITDKYMNSLEEYTIDIDEAVEQDDD